MRMPSCLISPFSRHFVRMAIAILIGVSYSQAFAQDDSRAPGLLHARQLMQIVEADGKGYYAQSSIKDGATSIAVPVRTSLGAVVVPPNVTDLTVTTPSGAVLATWSRSHGQVQIGEDKYSPVTIYARDSGESVEIVLGLYLKDGGTVKCVGSAANTHIAVRGIEFAKEPNSSEHGSWPMPENRKEWDTKLLDSTKRLDPLKQYNYSRSNSQSYLYRGRFTWLAHGRTTAPTVISELRLSGISGTSTLDFLTNTRIEIWNDGEMTVDAPLLALVSGSSDPSTGENTTLRSDSKISAKVHPITGPQEAADEHTTFLFRWPIMYQRSNAIALEYTGKADRVKFIWSSSSTWLPEELNNVKFRCETRPMFIPCPEDHGKRSCFCNKEARMIVGTFVDGRKTSYSKLPHYQHTLVHSPEEFAYPLAPMQSVGRIYDSESVAAYRGRWLYADPIFVAGNQAMNTNDLLDRSEVYEEFVEEKWPFSYPTPTIVMMYTYSPW